MNLLPVTTLNATLLGLAYVGLAWRVIHLRRRHRVPIGDGGHDALTRAIRAHGNFAEYVPISLILLLLGELNGLSGWLLAGFSALVVTGRIYHARAFLSDGAHLRQRVLGMQLTFLGIAGLAIGNLIWLTMRWLAPPAG